MRAGSRTARRARRRGDRSDVTRRPPAHQRRCPHESAPRSDRAAERRWRRQPPAGWRARPPGHPGSTCRQQRTHQGAQPPLGPVADDGTPHRLPDDEPHSHGPVGRGACDVDDERARACPPTASNGQAELGGAAQAVRCREHDAGRRRGVRRRVRRGPCGGARRGWRGPRECASAAGSRASWPGAGCSAGRSACSPVRLSTHDCRGSGNRNAGWRQRAHRAQGTAILAAVKPEHGTSVRGPGSNQSVVHWLWTISVEKPPP